MKRKDLQELYKKVAKEIGFKEDKSHKGWMPKLGPNDYKCKIAHGLTGDGPATLTVGPKGFIDPEAWELAVSYGLLEKKKNPCIVLPKVFGVGNFDDRAWVIRERIDGQNPLSYFPVSSQLEKNFIAELYWNTVAVFSDVQTQRGCQSKVFFEDFFRERLNKWLGLHSSLKGRADRQKHQVLKSVVENVFSYVFFESNISDRTDLDMNLFFKNFGATDIVRRGQSYYLPSSDIEFLPEFYGAAYFVWNVILYIPGKYSYLIVEDWHNVFEAACPENLREMFSRGFYLIFFERVMAALLVDISLKRSPFDIKDKKKALERAKKAEKIFAHILEWLLIKIPTLVKNEPFKENLADLKKVYKP